MTTAGLLALLAERLAAGETMVWVTVAATRGSTPRNAGARMLVGRCGSYGSIGGGQLEWRALAVARELLEGRTGPAARVQRFALGASVGQCCGGVVGLAFDRIAPANRGWVAQACAAQRSGRAWLRVVPLGEDAPAVAVHVADAERSDREPATLPRAVIEAARRLGEAHEAGAAIAEEAATGRRWLVEAFRPAALSVALFGAGHVGRALVELLGRLPVSVTWIDSRDDAFPAALPANTTAVCSDAPEAEIGDLASGCAALVMTHSHALDFALVRAWLDRGDFGFLGLIGSRAKRASFLQRLRARGYHEAALARLVCPIGLPEVIGKEPEVIALAVAAQLMSLRLGPLPPGAGIRGGEAALREAAAPRTIASVSHPARSS